MEKSDPSNSNHDAQNEIKPLVDFVKANRSRIKIDSRAFLSSLACCICNRKHRDRLKLAEIKVRKELDLVQFVEKQRFFSILALLLLSPSKHYLIKRMSALKIDDLEADFISRTKSIDSDSDREGLQRRGLTAAIKNTQAYSSKSD